MELFKGSLALFNLNLFNPANNKGVVNLVNDMVCYNQGELAQYTYLAGEKHKLMKEELRSASTDKAKVQSYKEELEIHLNAELKKVIKGNFARILKYFDGRSKQAPRVCIKVAKDDNILDFFREDNRFYVTDCKRKENSGFASVYETGKYYLCNDIPYEVKAGRYENPRIDKRKAILYKKSSVLNWWNQKQGREDADWISCWKESSVNGNFVTPHAKQCYKSTLVIPMTLVGNDLSRDFKQQFRILEDKPGRAIYGFLCLDHHHRNFFKPEMDVAVGYIFADLISLYLISNLTYIDYSKTFKAAVDYVN